jgi:hypothetical protein
VTDQCEPSAESIVRVLRGYLPQKGLFVAPDIPATKLANAKRSCSIPDTDSLVGLIDCTVSGSAKDCLAFGCQNLYFHNRRGSLATPEAGAISYSQFPARAFTDGGWFRISLGQDDCLSVSGCAVPKDTIVDILRFIRKSVVGTTEETEEEASPDQNDADNSAIECPVCGSTDTLSERGGLGKAAGWIAGAAVGGAIGAAVGLPWMGQATMSGVGARAGASGPGSRPTCQKCGHKWTLTKRREGPSAGKEEMVAEPTSEELELIAAVSAAASDQPRRRLEIILDKLMPEMPGYHWYRHPTIPPKKLAKATAKYAPELTGEMVLALADGAFFGSAERGCLLSVHGIHFNTSGGSGQVAWADIEKAVSVGGFPQYWLELVLKSGDKVRLECSKFDQARCLLEKTINWIAHFSEVDVRSEPTGTLEEN